MLKIPPSRDVEEEITTIHLKIKLFFWPKPFIISSTYLYILVYVSCKFYGLQVKQRFEVLKKRRAPGSFTEQGKELEGSRKKLLFLVFVCVRLSLKVYLIGWCLVVEN